ncbi:hypothetical protein BXZ70DRAFT_225220 [Cristinia sonorae]|uniref:MYND-type domain-containing protein n=1 Tax=Cristinia sonorae TaxID=1940300 RepID=A0A8K0UNG5_9AGAR|nr:hypothetical protein BXZ70DRAFT_225220 [Cristinia sonorae]
MNQDLNRLPPAHDECESCHRMEDEGITLRRCSTCKTKFYCSERCQLKDWKSRKFDCSLLPIGTLEYRTALSDDAQAQLDAEVQRVSELLYAWEQACEEYTEGSQNSAVALSKVSLPEDQLIKDINQNLAAPYSSATYTRVPKDHKTYPFRLSLALITRLFLIHITTPSASISEESIQYLETLLSGVQGPDPMWAPKYLCLPGALSPGEYDLLAQMLPVYARVHMRGKQSDAEKEEGKKKGTEAWKKTAYESRFFFLALLYKRRFMTK